MRKLIYILSIATFVIAGAAEAGGNGNGSKKKSHKSAKSQGKSHYSHGYHCPPGLAKKPIPCVPPGQAKQLYWTGDRILRDFDRILNPENWGLDTRQTYYRSNGYVYSVDPETDRVLRVIGLVADLF